MRFPAILVLLFVTASCDDATSTPASSLPAEPQVLPDIDAQDGLVLFPLTRAGATVERSVLLTNGGQAALVFSDVHLAGADAAAFSLGALTPASQSLASGETLIVPVTFAPAGRGVYQAALVTASNAENFSSLTIALAAPASAEPTPAGADIAAFDDTVNVAVGQSAVALVYYYNLGAAPLYVTGFALDTASGAFGLHPDSALGTACSSEAPCPSGRRCVANACAAVPLLAGEVGYAMVVFTPSVAGADTAELRIESSDPDEAVVSVAIEGTGI